MFICRAINSFVWVQRQISLFCVNNVPSKEYWPFFSETKTENDFLFDALVLNKSLQGSHLYSISDAGGAKKRNAQHIIFSALSCYLLRSHHATHINDQNRLKRQLVRETKARHSAYSPVCERVFNHWLCVGLEELFMQGEGSSSLSCPTQLIDGILFVLWSGKAILAVHEYLCLVPYLLPESGTEVTSNGSTPVVLARFGARLSTSVTWVGDDGTNEAGGCEQIIYDNPFAASLQKTNNQLVANIKIFIKELCWKELSICIPSILIPNEFK